MSTGERIRDIRMELGLSMEEFGALVGNADRSLVSRWENGKNYPNKERLKKISKLGKITFNELVTGQNEINNKQVGHRIFRIRSRKGLTQEEFGKCFKAKKGIVSRWESGLNLPNRQRIEEIASFGGITVDELLYGKETNGKTYDSVYLTDDEVEIINLLRANETPLNEFIGRQEEYIASLEDSLNRIAIAHQDIRVSCGDVKDNIMRTFWNKSLTLDEIKATHGE